MAIMHLLVNSGRIEQAASSQERGA
jgi:hypothetical protein